MLLESVRLGFECIRVISIVGADLDSDYFDVAGEAISKSVARSASGTADGHSPSALCRTLLSHDVVDNRQLVLAIVCCGVVEYEGRK